MHELRPYQKDFKINLSKEIRDHKHVIGCSPGGTGKTLVFSHIAKDASSKGRSVLILTHRKSIFGQNSKASNGIDLNPNTPRNVEIKNGVVYVAMVQTIRNRPEWISRFNSLSVPVLVIVDEAHLSDYSETLINLTNRITIGMTATPYYKTAKHLPIFYNKLVETNSIDWFIQNDYLCSYQHHSRTNPDLINHLGSLQSNGEYSPNIQTVHFEKQQIYDGLIEDLSKGRSYKKCMIFCANIKNAELIYEKIKSAGYLVTIGHSKRIDEEYQVALFKSDDSGYNIFVSVAAYTVGFDHPPVDRLCLYRAFGSISLYLQTLYRADRICENKNHFDVYDYGDNWRRHGLYYFDRDWPNLWNKVEDKKQSDALGTYSVKECANCGSIISIMSRICTYCGNEQPENEQELKQGVLLDITEKYQALVGRRLSSLTPTELSVYAKIKQKLQFAIRVAKANRQRALKLDPNTKDNFLKDFGTAMGYSDKWYNVQSAMLKKEKSDIFYSDIVLK